MASPVLALLCIVRTHGWPAVKDMLEQLNSGQSHRLIATRLGVSHAKLSRLVNALFERRWIFKQELLSYFEEQQERNAQDIEHYKRERRSILRLASFLNRDEE